ncbi:MAG TPA: ATP phosphoribosyltransferase [Gammaproteobacteria bacterium]|nr:ATP phosphoribosyltransferase [Gammaproteobacteria bacterium]
MITLALSKGRILEQALPLLYRAGIEPEEDPRSSRKLVIPVKGGEFRLLVIRAQDVPIYVEYGAADLGISGKDVLMELGGLNLYEPLDLGIARCRMVVAGRRDRRGHGKRPRVATKYAETTRRFFAERGTQVEIIPLSGSMELAPQVGLADWIVDLVDTGNTLKANGLVVLDDIAEISSRLVVNKGSMKMKHSAIKAVIDRLADAVSASAIQAAAHR